MNSYERKILKATSSKEVELSKVEVNLGLTQDADKAISEFYTKYDTAISKVKGAISSLREAGVAFEKADGTASLLEDFDSKLEKAAKELGVNTNDWAVSKEIKTAIKESKRVNDYIKTINKAISSL